VPAGGVRGRGERPVARPAQSPQVIGDGVVVAGALAEDEAAHEFPPRDGELGRREGVAVQRLGRESLGFFFDGGRGGAGEVMQFGAGVQRGFIERTPRGCAVVRE
jgi:hypothetical protein